MKEIEKGRASNPEVMFSLSILKKVPAAFVIAKNTVYSKLEKILVAEGHFAFAQISGSARADSIMGAMKTSSTS